MEKSSVNWKELYSTAGIAVAASLIPMIGPLWGVSRLLGKILGPYSISKTIKKGEGDFGKVRPTAVGISDAKSNLTFPPGHPNIDHVYAGHPLKENYYIPLAIFHRQLFEEKVNALMELLASLCATHVRVSASKGYDRAGGIHLGVDTAIYGSYEVGASVNKGHKQVALFEEVYRPDPNMRPSKPNHLMWYGGELSWQAMADRRINYNTKDFHITLRYEDSFGIDGNLKVGLEKFGVNLGGSFTDFEATNWEFEGEFADRPVEGKVGKAQLSMGAQ